MLKHLKDILPRLTSHGVGEKRVLLSAGETETAVTQIAVTTLHAGETANGHSHATMEEYFFFLHGEAALTIDGERTACHEGDFVQIRKVQNLKNYEKAVEALFSDQELINEA